MKKPTTKRLSLLLSATVCMSLLLPLFLCVCGAARALGDVNGDGNLTAADARLALRAAVGLEYYASGSEKFVAADVNGDGKLTAADARMILRAAVGLERLGQSASAGNLKAAAMQAYRAEVKRIVQENAGGRNPDTAQFLLYDMDLNGIPELILYYGYKTNTATTGMGVYTYTADGGLILLGYMRTYADVLFDFTPGDGSIRAYFAYHGYVGEFEYRIVNNTLTETTITALHEETYSGNTSEYEKRMQEVSQYVISTSDQWIPANSADSYFNSI